MTNLAEYYDLLPNNQSILQIWLDKSSAENTRSIGQS